MLSLQLNSSHNIWRLRRCNLCIRAREKSFRSSRVELAVCVRIYCMDKIQVGPQRTLCCRRSEENRRRQCPHLSSAHLSHACVTLGSYTEAVTPRLAQPNRWRCCSSRVTPALSQELVSHIDTSKNGLNFCRQLQKNLMPVQRAGLGRESSSSSEPMKYILLLERIRSRMQLLS